MPKKNTKKPAPKKKKVEEVEAPEIVEPEHITNARKIAHIIEHDLPVDFKDLHIEPDKIPPGSLFTLERRMKIEVGFAMGYSQNEVCAFGQVGKETLLEWFKSYPNWAEKCKWLQSNPVLIAKRTMFASLDDPNHARWFLERKCRDEFGLRATITHKVGEEELTEEEAQRVNEILAQSPLANKKLS